MKLKQNTKIKITSSDISFFTTVKQIREGVGSNFYFNSGVQAALQSLEDQTSKLVRPIGVAGSWINYPIQLDITE